MTRRPTSLAMSQAWLPRAVHHVVPDTHHPKEGAAHEDGRAGERKRVSRGGPVSMDNRPPSLGHALNGGDTPLVSAFIVPLHPRRMNGGFKGRAFGTPHGGG